MLDVEVRELQKNDIKEVTNLVANFFEIKDLENGYNQILSFYTDYKSIVAIYNNRIVGHILGFSKYDAKEAKKFFWLEYVCVDEEFQGKGIATKMLKRIEALAKNKGITYIKFTSSNFRKKAHACYLKNGYEKVDTTVFQKYV